MKKNCPESTRLLCTDCKLTSHTDHIENQILIQDLCVRDN